MAEASMKLYLAIKKKAESKYIFFKTTWSLKKYRRNKHTFFKATRSFSGFISCMATKTSAGVNAGPV